MNSEVIKECTALSLSEQITFPVVVKKLAEAGVERYFADLVGKKKYSYGALGETHTGELPIESIAVPSQFNASQVKQSIEDIQQDRIGYRTFLRRIMESGCSHYEVFITGRRAIYFGRNGENHIEEFPQK